MLLRIVSPVSRCVTRTALRGLTTSTSAKVTVGRQSQEVFDREDKYGAHNYHPIPVALAKGEGNQLAELSQFETWQDPFTAAFSVIVYKSLTRMLSYIHTHTHTHTHTLITSGTGHTRCMVFHRRDYWSRVPQYKCT